MAKKTAAGTRSSRSSRPTSRGKLPPIEKAVEGDLAAPGKRHQLTRGIGEGTPSADARPGMTVFTQDVLDEDPDVVNERLRQRSKSKMKVQATKAGLYDNARRRPGEVFFIYGSDDNPIADRVVDDPDNPGKKKTIKGVFSKNWMRRVPDKTQLTGTKGPNQIIREQHDEILGVRSRSGRIGMSTDLEPGVEDTGDNPLDAD